MLTLKESLVVICAPVVVCNVVGDFAEMRLKVCFKLELLLLAIV